MTGGIVLFAISLLHLIEAQELQHVFVLHGNDLRLDVKNPVELDENIHFYWKFNTSNNVGNVNSNGNTVLYGSYKGRAELFGQNYSLLLKNVQHSDSGDYTAFVVGEKDKKVAEHKVIVQDPATAAKLTVDAVSSSSDSCNLTVTCSIVDLNISSTFRCDAQNCSQIGKKSLNATKKDSSLIVYLQQDTIVCNHSNQVSWKKSTAVLKSFCETKLVFSGATKAVISTALLTLLASLIVLCFVRKCKGRRGNQENTIYAVPQDILPGQTQNQTPSGDVSCCSPTSTYALVEFHTGPESTKTKITPQPETVYAQVDRAAKQKTNKENQIKSK